MSKPWNGMPLEPKRDWWHIIELKGKVFVRYWTGNGWLKIDTIHPPEWLAGCNYLGPVTLPGVEARAERDRIVQWLQEQGLLSVTIGYSQINNHRVPITRNISDAIAELPPLDGSKPDQEPTRCGSKSDSAEQAVASKPDQETHAGEG